MKIMVRRCFDYHGTILNNFDELIKNISCTKHKYLRNKEFSAILLYRSIEHFAKYCLAESFQNIGAVTKPLLIPVAFP